MFRFLLLFVFVFVAEAKDPKHTTKPSEQELIKEATAIQRVDAEYMREIKQSDRLVIASMDPDITPKQILEKYNIQGLLEIQPNKDIVILTPHFEELQKLIEKLKLDNAVRAENILYGTKENVFEILANKKAFHEIIEMFEKQMKSYVYSDDFFIFDPTELAKFRKKLIATYRKSTHFRGAKPSPHQLENAVHFKRFHLEQLMEEKGVKYAMLDPSLGPLNWRGIRVSQIVALLRKLHCGKKK